MKTLSSMLLIPESAGETLRLMVDHDEFEILAGGTALYPEVGPAGSRRVGLISLHRASDLSGISQEDEYVRIGATTPISWLLADPVIAEQAPILSQAARTMASRQVRARATLGGNVVIRRPDQTFAPALLALDASVGVLTDSGAARRDLAALLSDSAIGPRTLLTDVQFRPVPGFQLYTRVGPRNGPGYPIVSVAVVADAANRKIRIALGNSAATPIRASAAEAFASEHGDWDGRVIAADSAVEAGRLAAQECEPATDLAATAEYRRHAIAVMVRRAMERAFGEGGQ